MERQRPEESEGTAANPIGPRRFGLRCTISRLFSFFVLHLHEAMASVVGDIEVGPCWILQTSGKERVFLLVHPAVRFSSPPSSAGARCLRAHSHYKEGAQILET